MQWAEDARTKFREILADVPSMFRSMAETMSSSAAEKLAGERGAGEVSLDDMIRGMIRITPGHMHENLKQLFSGHGVDVKGYEAEFQS